MKKILVIVLTAMLAVAWFLNITTMAEDAKMYKKYMLAGQKYAEKELYEDAVNMYTSALLLKADSKEATLGLARANKALDNNKAFVTGCVALISTDPISKEALTELLEYYYEVSKYDTLINTIKNVKARYPKDEDVNALWNKYEGIIHRVGSRYTTLSQLYNGYTLGMVKDSTYLIDATGSSVFEEAYESVGYVSSYNNLVAVCKDGNWYYVNVKDHKKLVSDEAYEYCGLYSDGYAVAMKNGKYGYIDDSMKPVTDFTWDQATNIYRGVGAVCKDGKWALINDSFEKITDYKYDDIAISEMNFCSTNARVFAKDASGYHMLDEKGEEVSSDTYDEARAFTSASYAAVCKNGKWGFVSGNGEIFIDYQYDNAKNFGAGYAPVLKDGLWGYINEQNIMAVEPQFEDAYPFTSNGVAPVANGSYYLIKLYAISKQE